MRKSFVHPILSNKILIFLPISNSSIKDKHAELLKSPSPLQHESTTSVPGMDDAEFRRRGKEMIDYIADYLKNIK